MDRKTEQTPVSVGLLAHVDAGKTTLAEGLLYESGAIRKPGRVDHGDAFLDTFALERARGITIFSKLARIRWQGREYRLMDTPGHADFSAEMERTLRVLDYAVLIISGSDGVQGHDRTLWKLLKEYEIPVFIFLNKMDMPDTDPERLMGELRRYFDGNCIAFPKGLTEETEIPEAFWEEAALCSEELMQEYLDTGAISDVSLQKAIRRRQMFPCFFGSALKLQGVREFLEIWNRYMACPDWPEEFGARVYKITRDSQGNRLTHLKLTGGRLRVKQLLEGENGESEKVDQIRLYSGAAFQTAEEVAAGEVCAVTGLQESRAGMGYGKEKGGEPPLLEPVLTYRILLPEGCDVHDTYLKLLRLEEEEPQLHIAWDERSQELHARVMGEVQIEILKSMIAERYGLQVEFGSGSITYKETIAAPVEGVGHFEPLRHYAEVHLLLEPGERGSGLQFASRCSEDLLDRNWQRLILTHLEERQHPGVLTGSEITDMRITLVAGRAHLKHTEGGDFRQATYRAVRQGLRTAESVLLEPVYSFSLEIPSETVGRAMSDLTRMHAEFGAPVLDGDRTRLTGTAPVSEMRGYPSEVLAYTRGQGKLFCTLKGYELCHNPEEVVAAAGYDPEADTDNPTGSVFCAHGAGFVVPWDQVRSYMHLEGYQGPELAGGTGTYVSDFEGSVGAKSTEVYGSMGEETATQGFAARKTQTQRIDTQGIGSEEVKTQGIRAQGSSEENSGRRTRTSAVYAASAGWGDEKELEEIFTRTYGSGRENRSGWSRSRFEPVSPGRPAAQRENAGKKEEKEYLLVDGYNIIFAVPQLKELAQLNMDSARTRLMDLLCNYQGYRQCTLILVYDAYKVEGGTGSVMKYHNIYVVYTKEAETADQYIEKTVHEIGRKYHVTVATSDALEQRIIWGSGAARMSAKGLWEELELVRQEIREQYLEKQPNVSGQKLFQNLNEELAAYVEEVRLGKQKS